jgi:cell division septation protein DedD
VGPFILIALGVITLVEAFNLKKEAEVNDELK